jgi:Ca-activated chloride channel homolog
MPSPRVAGGVLQVLLPLLCLTGFLSTIGQAQTSLSDVHIPSRSIASATTSGIAPETLRTSGLSVIRTDVRLVLVPVSVTDDRQRLVTGLGAENFQLYEGKRAQPIRHFSMEDVPASIGIILDSSGSMADKMGRVREAVSAFCREANPADEFFMIVFSDEPRLANDFTAVPDDLDKELLFTQPKGRTSLLDAIYMGLHKMKDAKYAKKALLIISDGGDNRSRYSEKDVRSAAKESDVMIYTIGTFDRYVTTPEESRGPMLLADIAEPSGGRAYMLDRTVELPAIARHIGRELRTQYVLGYRPEDLRKDGKWHKIQVKLRLPKKWSFLKAHAKSGYYAAEQ